MFVFSYLYFVGPNFELSSPFSPKPLIFCKGAAAVLSGCFTVLKAQWFSELIRYSFFWKEMKSTNPCFVLKKKQTNKKTLHDYLTLVDVSLFFILSGMKRSNYTQVSFTHSLAAPEKNVKVLKSVRPIRYSLVLCFSYTPGPLHWLFPLLCVLFIWKTTWLAQFPCFLLLAAQNVSSSWRPDKFCTQ